jgi:O-antigen/teichoic acid export membrane protein
MLLVLERHSLSWLIVAWAIGASSSVIFGIIVLKPRVSLRLTVSWLGRVHRVGFHYLADFIVSGGLTQLVTFVVAIAAGFQAAGDLRAAQLLLTPLNMFTVSMTFALAPQVSRLAAIGDLKRLRRLPFQYGSTVALISILCVVFVSLLPDVVLKGLMGESMHGGLEVFPYAAFAMCIMGVAVGPGLTLRAVGKVRASMLIKAVTAPLTLVLVWFGATTSQAVGSQAGLAAGTLMRATGSRMLMTRALTDYANQRKVLVDEKIT